MTSSMPAIVGKPARRARIAAVAFVGIAAAACVTRPTNPTSDAAARPASGPSVKVDGGLVLTEQNAALRRRALALSAANAAQHDDLAGAEERYRRALDGDETWPGAARALGDLGLVRLRRGDEEGGLDWLRRARARFAAEEDWSGLAGSLANEARYQRWRGRLDEAAALEKAQKAAEEKASAGRG